MSKPNRSAVSLAARLRADVGSDPTCLVCWDGSHPIYDVFIDFATVASLAQGIVPAVLRQRAQECLSDVPQSGSTARDDTIAG